MEAATIARRLAFKLGCESVALVGCVRPELITGLAGIHLAGWDTPAHVSDASALLPAFTWGPIDDAPDGIAKLPSALAVLSARLLDELDGRALASIAGQVPAAVVYDADGTAGRGPAALRALIARAEAHGAQVIRAELVAPADGTTDRRCSPMILIGAGHDDRASYLVGGGFHGLRLDPAADESQHLDRATRVCIVSYEVVGPCRNGGIGTANTSLALALARAGQDVTLIYSGEPSAPLGARRWRAHFGDRGVTYRELPREAPAAVSSPFINYRRAWAAYQLVLGLHRECPFDVIHGPDCQGHLMFIALAKRHELAFSEAQVVSGLHSPSRWCYEANLQPFGLPGALADDQMEKVAVESSDVVVSPSRYRVDYVRSRGWRLPERTFVQQYLRSEAIRERIADAAPASADDTPAELVFFGRLETRKGLETFCDALDRLVDEQVARTLSVTFMGASTWLNGRPSEEYISRRAGSWPWPVRVETGMSQPEAVRYLHSRRCLAVMPSLVDNSPNTVYEAIELAVPFIASRSGGTTELIALRDLERCTFSGWDEEEGPLEPAAAGAVPGEFDDRPLADVLRRALHESAAPARPAVDPEVNEACHLAWHRALAACGPASGAAEPPTLSIIRAWRSPAAQAELPGGIDITLEDGEHPRSSERAGGWTMAAAGRTTVAGAYDIAAQAASGGLLLFIPADVAPEPEMPDVVGRAAAASDADVFLYGVGSASEDRRDPRGVILPPVGPALLAICLPVFEGIGCAIRADVLRRLGGFRHTDRSDDPATTLITRAVLAGAQVEVIPAVLGRRLVPADGAVESQRSPWAADAAGTLELLRPFAQAAGDLADLPALYRAMCDAPGSDVRPDESLRQGFRRLLRRERERHGSIAKFLRHRGSA